MSPSFRHLRIAVIAHVRHPVASPFMGGMEAHSDLLVRALGRRGHDVVLFASGDSATDLPLRPIAPLSYEQELPWAQWHGKRELLDWLAAAYARAWEGVSSGRFDIVHNNALFPDLHDWARRDGVPMLTSLHVPPFRLLQDALERTRGCASLRQTVTSGSQLPLWTTLDQSRVDVAWNGIDLSAWPYWAQGNGRAIWFGRITPNKGTIEALQAASAAGIGLDVVGPVECADYFATVQPLLTDPHRYWGQLSGEALSERVRAASVMIATPMWDEPFGLTVAEAMASGVPVAALDRGAMREVIGNTGEIASNISTLPAAIRRAMNKSRSACRGRVEKFFSADAMVERYERAYAATISGAVSRASNIRRTAELLA